MTPYIKLYSLLLLLVLAGDVSAAVAGQSTGFFSNEVCMSLAVYIVSLLLPARDITDWLVNLVPGLGEQDSD